MKVVQINATYGEGSTGIIVQDIGQMLREIGEAPRFVYQFGLCPKTEGFKIGNKLDWKWHALYTRLVGMQGYASKMATRKLIKYLLEEKPDVVHLHNVHSNYLNFNLLFAFLAKEKIATVLTLHDCWFFTGKCCHFIVSNCNRWQEGCGSCPCIKEDIKSMFFDKTSKVLKDKRKAYQQIENLTVIGCSDWICELAKKAPVFQGKKIFRIYNGIDINIFQPKDREKLRKEFLIDNQFVIMGMANKWLDKKNNTVFSAVVEKLSSEMILFIVGCDETQLEALKSFSNVRAYGFIKERKKLANLYNVADVFVNLTYEDTLPTVNMEALGCGTPVITYDSCGSPELVKESETGYIVPQGDSNLLIERIECVRDRKISRNSCVQYAKKCFDKRRQYLEYIQMYRAISNLK